MQHPGAICSRTNEPEVDGLEFVCVFIDLNLGESTRKELLNVQLLGASGIQLRAQGVSRIASQASAVRWHLSSLKCWC